MCTFHRSLFCLESSNCGPRRPNCLSVPSLKLMLSDLEQVPLGTPLLVNICFNGIDFFEMTLCQAAGTFISIYRLALNPSNALTCLCDLAFVLFPATPPSSFFCNVLLHVNACILLFEHGPFLICQGCI